MSLNSEKTEIGAIIHRLLDNLLATAPSNSSVAGSYLRYQVGVVRATYIELIIAKQFSTALLGCFTKALEANASFTSLDRVRQQLANETPVGDIAKTIVIGAIIFCLSTECRLIKTIEFVSRDDVDAMMQQTKIAFDSAKEMAADLSETAPYKTLLSLAASSTRYLMATARPLPRMISFTLGATLPALTLSNRLYYDASRWDELVQENKIIHPLFCPRVLRGLSA